MKAHKLIKQHEEQLDLIEQHLNDSVQCSKMLEQDILSTYKHVHSVANFVNNICQSIRNFMFKLQDKAYALSLGRINKKRNKLIQEQDMYKLEAEIVSSYLLHLGNSKAKEIKEPEAVNETV